MEKEKNEMEKVLDEFIEKFGGKIMEVCLNF